ncbi:MAG: NAD(P)/FAD-dependent oxidoreductase [Actinophytocola sp.]|uniref:phytoene desaturase family protein n=1 Tax=Actinophytocola sp. TaxID=1872138 RepID=UPI003C78BECD
MSRDIGPDWGDRTPGGEPRVIIIGAGIAGLATGCYGQMNGLATRVFEKHVLPGGCCTAWSRQGYVFDYCIEWLIGTAKGNDANQIWRELGALDGKTIKNFEMFNRVVDTDGRAVTFYHDPDRLQRHLLDLSPIDAALIRSFCQDLRRFVDIDLYPFLTPPPLRTTREKLRTLATVLPAFRLFWRTAATQMDTFAGRFSDPLLRRALPFIFFQDHEVFPLLPYLFNLAGAHNDNAGFPQGGSLGLARSIEQRYLSLGGVLTYRTRVRRILVEDGRAVGVELRDGTRQYADHVVSACDGHTTIYDLLEGRHTSPRVDKLYTDILHRPNVLYPGVVSAFVGVDGELDPAEAHSTTYLLSDEEAAALPGVAQNSIVVQLRSHYSDGFAPPGKSVIHCTYFSDFGYWQALRRTSRREYWARKDSVADFVRDFLTRRFPGLRIELVSVASPVTTMRYTGNLDGAILAFKSFTEADDVTAKMISKDRMGLPGLRNFWMAGQWIGGGGLIRAASTGRFVTQYLCHELGREFRATESTREKPWHRDDLGYLPQLEHRPRPVATRRR